MNTATLNLSLPTDNAPFLTDIFSYHFLASDIPPFVMIPSEHSILKLALTPSSLENNVLLATGPQSCRVTSCTQE